MKNLFGIYKGIVVSNKDPLGTNRLLLNVPQVFPSPNGGVTYPTTGWCPPSTSSATPPALPLTGEVVWVCFEAGDSDHPVWFGTTLIPPITQTYSFTPVSTQNNPSAIYAQHVDISNVFNAWPGLGPVPFTKARPDTRLIVDMRLTGYCSAGTNLIQLNLQERDSFFQVLGGLFFSQLNVHHNVSGTLTLLPGAVPIGPLNLQVGFVSPGNPTLVWDHNDFATIIITETV